MSADESREAEDPRLISAVKEYMALLEAGVHPNRQEFLARYPEIASELATCLDGLAFVHSAAAQMQGPAAAAQVDEESATARPLGDFKLIREVGRGGAQADRGQAVAGAASTTGVPGDRPLRDALTLDASPWSPSIADPTHVMGTMWL